MWVVSPVSLLSGGRKSPSDFVVSLFFLSQKLHVPEARARASLITDICRLWWVCVCLYTDVFVCMHFCVCVCGWDLRVSFSSGRTESLLMDTKEKKTWKEDRIYHVKQKLSWISPSFCFFTPSCSLRSHLVSLVVLGWFSVTISDWPTTRSKSRLTAPALVHLLFPLLFPLHHLCWQSGSVSQICLSASWPSSLNSSSFLWVSQSIIFDPILPFTNPVLMKRQHVFSKPPQFSLVFLNKSDSWI